MSGMKLPIVTIPLPIIPLRKKNSQYGVDKLVNKLPNWFHKHPAKANSIIFIKVYSL
jgi:hypothetical protein